METCFEPVSVPPGFLQLNYCREGCFEIETVEGSFGFLGEGDLVVNDPHSQPVRHSRLPLGHFVGVTLLFHVQTAQQSLEALFPDSGISLHQLRDKFCGSRTFFLLRAQPEVNRVYTELYQMDDCIRPTYAVLKTVELLLYLSLRQNEPPMPFPHFSRQVVQATLAACALAQENPFAVSTIGEMASRFAVAPTSLRECFKCLYGQPAGAFLRVQRIRRAAEKLLSHRDLSVCQVAQWAGYENQSKFASAFKAVMGCTPLAYRRQTHK
ncbi:MAG: AraC family transcriptional regulator [Clostridia bacterium]|nr:AraC family transcriptional regulator [Clostridia bacterium]